MGLYIPLPGKNGHVRYPPRIIRADIEYTEGGQRRLRPTDPSWFEEEYGIIWMDALDGWAEINIPGESARLLSEPAYRMLVAPIVRRRSEGTSVRLKNGRTVLVTREKISDIQNRLRVLNSERPGLFRELVGVCLDPETTPSDNSVRILKERKLIKGFRDGKLEISPVVRKVVCDSEKARKIRARRMG